MNNKNKIMRKAILILTFLLVVPSVFAWGMQGLATIEWFKTPESAQAGELFKIMFKVKNDGVMDKIWVRITDLDTNEQIYYGERFLRHNEPWVQALEVKMPSRELTLKLEAGHFEGILPNETAQVLDSYMIKKINLEPECGNGICEEGETYLTCPADCPPPPEPLISIEDVEVPDSAEAGIFYVDVTIKNVGEDSGFAFITLTANDELVFREDMFLEPNQSSTVSIPVEMVNEDLVIDIKAGHDSEIDSEEVRIVYFVPPGEGFVNIIDVQSNDWVRANETAWIYFLVNNTGERDLAFIRFRDMRSGEEIWFEKLVLEGTYEANVTLKMPGRDLGVKVEVGHYVDSEEVVDTARTVVIKLGPPLVNPTVLALAGQVVAGGIYLSGIDRKWWKS